MSASVLRSVFVWIAACLWLAPSANCNILPHLQAREIGETINQTLFTVALACLPIIARRTSTRAIKASLYGLGVCLLLWSIYNALHMGSQAQATATQGPRAVIALAKAHETQIAALKAEADAITSKAGYAYTGDAAVTAAETSLRLAVEAAAECRTKRGERCAKREGEVEALRKGVEKTAAARDLSERVKGIEENIRRERRALDELGQLPKTIDKAATVIASILSLIPYFHVSEEAISMLLLAIYATATEGMAFLGPSSTLSAFGERMETSTRSSPALPQGRGENEGMSTDHPLPLPKPVPRKRVENGDKEESVRKWLRDRTSTTAGSLLQCAEALGDHERWCRSQGREPLTQSSFGKVMREIGVEKTKRSGYLYYTGIALKRQPAILVVSN